MVLCCLQAAVSATERRRRLQLLLGDIDCRGWRHVCVTHDTDSEHDITDVVRTVWTAHSAEGTQHWGLTNDSLNVYWSIIEHSSLFSLLSPQPYLNQFDLTVVTCEIKLFWNNFEIISVFRFTCNHVWNWNKIISAAEIISATLNMLENILELQW